MKKQPVEEMLEGVTPDPLYSLSYDMMSRSASSGTVQVCSSAGILVSPDFPSPYPRLATTASTWPLPFAKNAGSFSTSFDFALEGDLDNLFGRMVRCGLKIRIPRSKAEASGVPRDQSQTVYWHTGQALRVSAAKMKGPSALGEQNGEDLGLLESWRRHGPTCGCRVRLPR